MAAREKLVIMQKLIRILVCLLWALGSSALAQSAPDNADKSVALGAEQADSMAPPLVGDHWTHEAHDEITGSLKYTTTNLVTDVTPTEMGVRTENIGTPGTGTLVYDHSWNVKSTSTWKYSPHDGTGVKLPLKVGNVWKIQSNDVLAARGTSLQRTGSTKVVAEESVTTGAGTFNTFKLETAITARSPADPTKKLNLVMTTWYAPSVNHWVKRNSKILVGGHVSENTVYELVDYGRR